MIHDLMLAQVSDPRNGRAQLGTITQADATALQAKGSHNNVPGHTFTTDGNAPLLPSANDHFPNIQSNLVPLFVSVGTFNGLQVQDTHAYWAINSGTDGGFPVYGIPFTVGV